jgi:hypothetical protein
MQGVLDRLAEMRGLPQSITVSVAQDVDTYRSRLMQKLEFDNFTGLVKFAIACGLTRP